MLNNIWRHKAININGDIASNLFDIGKNMNNLTGAELLFYQDQKTVRMFHISTEIDHEYDAIAREQEESVNAKAQHEQDEVNFIMNGDDEIECEEMNESLNDIFITQCVNRLGFVRLIETCTQTELVTLSSG